MGSNARKRALAAVAALAMVGAACRSEPEAAPPPPPEVYVADVVQRDVPVYLELVGQTEGFQDVEIRARVEGFLETRELPRGLVRQAGRPPLRDRSEAARGDSCGRRRPTRPRPRRGSPRPTTTSPGTRRSWPSRPSASRSSTTRWPNRTRRRSQVEAAKAAVEKATLDLELHARHVAHQRARRDDPGQGRAISSDAARARC